MTGQEKYSRCARRLRSAREARSEEFSRTCSRAAARASRSPTGTSETPASVTGQDVSAPAYPATGRPQAIPAIALPRRLEICPRTNKGRLARESEVAASCGGRTPRPSSATRVPFSDCNNESLASRALRPKTSRRRPGTRAAARFTTKAISCVSVERCDPPVTPYTATVSGAAVFAAPVSQVALAKGRFAPTGIKTALHGWGGSQRFFSAGTLGAAPSAHGEPRRPTQNR